MDYDSIYLTVELGLYDNFQEAVLYGSDNNDDEYGRSPDSLCQMNVNQLVSDTSYYTEYALYGDPTECPFPGTYHLVTYYKVPAIADTNFKYTPDIRFTFWSADQKRIGCVVSGAAAIRRAADRKAARGLLALALALSVFLGLFAVLLLLAHRRRRRIEALREGGKLRGGGGSQQRAYQYFRTLPNGQVIPLPATAPQTPIRHPVGPIPEDSEEDDEDDDDDALNISNPEYNETQIPTRPII